MAQVSLPAWGIRTWRDPSARTRCLECFNICLELLEVRYPLLAGKHIRMERACALIGAALDFDDQQLFALKLAARFHDVGMLAVSEDGSKPDGARAQPQNALRQHTELGARLIHRAFPDFPDAIEGIWYHHERPDGQGPFGLRNDEIPDVAAVVALTEAVDLMIRTGVAGSPPDPARIVTAIQRHSGQCFVRKVVAAFQKVAPRVAAALAQSPADTNLLPPAAAAPQAKPTQPAATLEKPRAASPTSAAIPTPTAPKTSASISPGAPLPKFERTKMLNLLRQGLHLKPLAPVVHQVMAVTNSGQTSSEDVARAIVIDQALSVRILRLANSSAFSRGRPVSTLKDAVSRIGIGQIRELVLTMDVIDQYQGPICPEFDTRLFWEHSIACGLFTVAIAAACNAPNSDDRFLWGLVHDVGRLMLFDVAQREYAEVLASAQTAGESLSAIERRVLSVDHCEVLQQALTHWNFSKELIDRVTSHHYTAARIARLPNHQIIDTAAIALANRLSHAMLLGSSGDEIVSPLDDLLELLKLPGEVLARIEASAPRELETLRISLLMHADASDWPDQAVKVRQRLSGPFEPIVICADPATSAYRMLCSRLRQGGDPMRPNIAIMHLRAAAEQQPLIEDLLRSEAELKCPPLPVLVICNDGAAGLDQGWLENRKQRVMQAPVALDTFVDSCNALCISDNVAAVT